jgi:hypothetical protein
MASIYPHRWTSAMGVSPEQDDGSIRIAGDEWLRALAGLTDAQIAHGLECCRLGTDEWPPSANAFRLRCLDVPCIDAVAEQIKARDYCRFTRQVLAYLDWTQYRASSGKVAADMLARAYRRACDYVMRGGVLPAEPVADIEHKPREFKAADPAVAGACIDQLARLFGGGGDAGASAGASAASQPGPAA